MNLWQCQQLNTKIYLKKIKAGPFSHCQWQCNMAQPLQKRVLWFPHKLNIQLPCKLAFALLGIYPREMKMCVHTKTCTQIFKPESKSVHCMILLTWHSGKGSLTGQRLSGARGKGLMALIMMVAPWLNIIHPPKFIERTLKRLNFAVCKLYLNNPDF